MKNDQSLLSNNYIQPLLLVLLILALPVNSFARQMSKDTAHKTTPLGTSAILGNVDGIDIEAMVQGPYAEVTALQVACVFEYTEGDIFNSPPALPAAVNGMVHLDHALNGLITGLRKSGRFTGHAFETLLITPPSGTIAAKQLLLIGLGDRNKFSSELMLGVAKVAMPEALRLGISNYAFASDLKDGGIDSPTSTIAGYAVKGAIDAYRTEMYLKSKGMANFMPLKKITILAGPSFYVASSQGIKSAIAELNK